MHPLLGAALCNLHIIKSDYQVTPDINSAATDGAFFRIGSRVSALCYRKVLKYNIRSRNFKDTRHTHSVNYVVSSINSYRLVDNYSLYCYSCLTI